MTWKPPNIKPILPIICAAGSTGDPCEQGCYACLAGNMHGEPPEY